MADEASGRSLYGHFGQADYNRTSKEWSFERHTDRNVLQPIEHGKIIVPAQPEHHAHDRSADGKAGQMRRLEKQSKALIQNHPDFQPASGLLADFARVSEGTIEAAERHDAMQGNLLAFGRIHDRSTDGFAEVVASPSGPTGSDVRIVQVIRSPSAGGVAEDALPEFPNLSNVEATWKGPGALIRSLCFARPIEATYGFLTVRLCTETVIFQPMLDKCSKEHRFKLDPNLVARIAIDRISGMPHADVAFNPWNLRQFAVVDQAGVWSVRELRNESPWIVSDALHSGSLEDSSTFDGRLQDYMLDDSQQAGSKSLDDGWARMAWVFSTTLLAICNRRRVVILNLENQTMRTLPSFHTVLEDGVGWYLDLAVVGPLYQYLLILTTSHILVHAVDWDEHGRLTLKCLTCTKHFRNPNDISLRFNAFYENDGVLMIIRSDLCSVITYYRVDFVNGEKVIVSDPSELAVARRVEQTSSDFRVIGVYMQGVPHEASVTQEATGSTTSASTPDGQLYSVYTLHKNLSIVQTTYANRPGHLRSRLIFGGAIEDAHTDNVSNLSHWGSTKALVSETGRPGWGFKDDNKRSEIRVGDTQQGGVQTSSKPSHSGHISFERTYRSLGTQSHSKAYSIGEAVKIVQSQMREPNVSIQALGQTSRELVAGELTVGNSEEANAALEALQVSQAPEENIETPLDLSVVPNKRLVLQPVEWPLILGSPYRQDTRSFSSLHNAVLEERVSSMGNTISESVRAAHQQLALRTAVEVTLASSVVRFEEPGQDQPSQERVKGEAFDLPLHPPGTPHTPRSIRSYFDASSQPQSPALPTPSRSATPSAFTTSSQASNAPAPEVARLSRYVSFSKPAPSTLPRSLNRVLAHWNLGADPASYDWQASSRHVTRQDEDEGGVELTEKERQRQQRRNDRYARRQERQREESQRLQMLSRAPPVFTESQPIRPQVGTDFSQATAGSQMAASQVVRGRHGGRPPKKKKRKAGF